MIEQVLTMKRTAALCLVGAFCSLNAQAQKIQVKGNLVDGTDEPLIGATVKVRALKKVPVFGKTNKKAASYCTSEQFSDGQILNLFCLTQWLR